VINQIDAHASVTLNGSGAGQVSLGPPAGTRWALDLANVSVVAAGTGAAPSAASTCTLYRGSTSGPQQQVDVAILTGNGAASGKVGGVPYFPGQVLWAVWTGGDPGAIATLQVYGKQAQRSDPPFESGPLGEGFAQIPPFLIVGVPGAQIVITSNVPAALTAYYTAPPHSVLSVTRAAILMYPDATDYFYQVTGLDAAGNVFYGTGWFGSGLGVNEATFVNLSGIGLGLFMDFSALSQAWGSFQQVLATFGSPTFPGSTLVFAGSSIVNFGSDNKGDIQWHGVSLPRGIAAVGTATASVTGIGTVMTTIITSDYKGVFKNGRAYRMHVHIPLIVSTAAGDVLVRWIQTNGTVIRPQQTWWRTLANGTIVPYDETLVFVNTSGADISNQDIRVQVATTAGANLASSVSGTAPGRFEIEDCGDQSLFPNAPSMA